MKITGVKTYVLKHKMSRPTGPSNYYFRLRSALLVKIETDAGHCGWGETVALPGLKSIIDDHYAPILIGRDPREHRPIWRDLWGQNFGNGVALGGVDIALEDLRGKALGLPVAELFGGRLRERVPAYASAMNYIEGLDPEDYYPREAAELKAQGFRAMKMRIGGQSMRRDLAAVEKVREVVGPDVKQGAVGWMIIGWMPTHMREQFHLGQGAAGFSALGYVYVFQFLGLWIGGFWSDRMSRTRPRVRLILPAFAFTIAAPAFWLTGCFDAIGFTIASLILWGVAEGFLGANMMPIICMVIDARYRATALGVLNCFTACFGGASIYLVGALRDAQVGIGVVLALAGLGVLGSGGLLFLVGYLLKRADKSTASAT